VQTPGDSIFITEFFSALDSYQAELLRAVVRFVLRAGVASTEPVRYIIES
jgi:hypothetical protein